MSSKKPSQKAVDSNLETSLNAAKWAVNMDVATDPSEKIALCKELDNNMYKDELYILAVHMGLPVNKSTTKKELCQLITEVSLDGVDEVDQYFYTMD